MRVTHILLLFGTLLSAVPAFAADGGPITVRGILVQCLEEPGQTDRSLAEYEANLRRILRFESYKAAGQGSARIAVSGKGALSIGQGNTVDIEVLEATGDRIRASVRWHRGDDEIMNTVLNLRRGVPAILGRSASSAGGEVYAALVIAQ